MLLFPSRRREGLGVGRTEGELVTVKLLPTPSPSRLREGSQ